MQGQVKLGCSFEDVVKFEDAVVPAGMVVQVLAVDEAALENVLGELLACLLYTSDAADE